MALKNMSLLTGATISASGGSALVFASDGQTIQNGVHLVVPADADYQTRRQATFKYRAPTLDPKTGSMSKDKKSMSYVLPTVLSTGQVVFNTVRIEREVHPSVSAAVSLDLLLVAVQAAFDSDGTAFWATGSTD